MHRCVAVVSSIAFVALLAAAAPPPSDPSTPKPVVEMKAKEKANRTKCSSNLRAMGSEACTDADQPAGDVQAMKVKEKGNRTKCSSNLRTAHGSGGGEGLPSMLGDRLQKGRKAKTSEDGTDAEVCTEVKTPKHDAAMSAIQNTR
jgi:hypothetical protein